MCTQADPNTYGGLNVLPNSLVDDVVLQVKRRKQGANWD